MQKIESTAENKSRQKSQVFHSSSTVFWCLVNNKKQVDTRISFLNHFLLKREISSVSMRLCLRAMSGELIKETIYEIKEPKVYSYSVKELLTGTGISKGEFAVYIDFVSPLNLSVPFCAVTSEIISPTTLDLVHTYGRALEIQEIGSKVDFATSYETGWTIWNSGCQYSNNLIFHNGRLHASLKFSLYLLINGSQVAIFDPIDVFLRPFGTYRLNLEQFLSSISNGHDLLHLIEEADVGGVDLKIKIEGLKSAFPRLLFACTETSNFSDNHAIEDLDKINFTHSNFDFDCAEQSSSSLSYGFINNPKYPLGVDTGFRYYPCKELCDLDIDGRLILDSSPIGMDDFSSLRVAAKSPIASRIVGANWSKWRGSSLIKECSTGTFIVEYVQFSGFWHWGRLLPSGDNFCAIISMLNPFADPSQSFEFRLRIFSEVGLCIEKKVRFKGSKTFLEISSVDIPTSNHSSWYVLTGEGVGQFNVFSTVFFRDLSDGTIEHAF